MIEYKIGSIRYAFDEEKKKGGVYSGSTVIMSGDNAVMLYNRFISEIDHKLRQHLRGKLEPAGIDPWTGKAGKRKS